MLTLFVIFAPRLTHLSADEIIGFTPPSLLISALLLWGLYMLKTVVTVIPLMVLYAAGGILFPMGWAIVITYVCVFTEISLGYLIGKHFGGIRENPDNTKNENNISFKFIDNQDKSTACFIARILPLPVDFVNMYFGSKRMDFLPYIIYSLLGLSPMLVSMVMAGRNLGNPLSPEFIIPFAVCLMIGAITFVIIYRIQRRRGRGIDSASTDNKS